MGYGIVHIDITTGARDDLGNVWKDNPEAAATITVMLEQLQADPKVLDKLTTKGDNTIGDYQINVKPWEKAKPRGNLWRFRILDTPATSHRIIYGYHWQTRQLCIFAIVDKDMPLEEFDYDNLNSDIAKRVLADWNALS